MDVPVHICKRACARMRTFVRVHVGLCVCVVVCASFAQVFVRMLVCTFSGEDPSAHARCDGGVLRCERLNLH